MPEYPGRHVQRYPVGPLPTHDPLFKHGMDKQIKAEIVKIVQCINRVDYSSSWNCWKYYLELGTQ